MGNMSVLAVLLLATASLAKATNHITDVGEAGRRQLLSSTEPKCMWLGQMLSTCTTNPLYYLSVKIPTSDPVGKALSDEQTRDYECLKLTKEGDCKSSTYGCEWDSVFGVCSAQSAGQYEPERGFMYCPGSKLELLVNCAYYSDAAPCNADANCTFADYESIKLSSKSWGDVAVKEALQIAIDLPSPSTSGDKCWPKWANDDATISAITASYNTARAANANKIVATTQWLVDLTGTCDNLKIAKDSVSNSCYKATSVSACFDLNTIFNKRCDWWDTKWDGEDSTPSECGMSCPGYLEWMKTGDTSKSWTKDLTDTEAACKAANTSDACKNVATFQWDGDVGGGGGGGAAATTRPALLISVIVALACLLALLKW